MDIKYLENLSKAKESVKVFLSNLEQVNFGNQMFAKANDLDKNNTDFAKWYFGEGQVFSSFDSFKILETFYNDMYDTFIKYMELKEKSVKNSLFSNKVKKRKIELDELFQEVKQNARKLIKSIELFEEKLKNSPLFDEYKPKTLYDFTEDLNIDLPINEIKNEFEFNVENLVDDVKLLNEDINQFEQTIHNEWLKPYDEIDAVREDNLSIEMNQDVENDNINHIDADAILEKIVKEKNEEDNVQVENEQINLKIEGNIFDFEKRLHEELGKMKLQIEKEIMEKLKNEAKFNIDTPPKIDSPVEQKNNEADHNNTEPIIDLDEEIRRILS